MEPIEPMEAMEMAGLSAVQALLGQNNRSVLLRYSRCTHTNSDTQTFSLDSRRVVGIARIKKFGDWTSTCLRTPRGF